MKLGRRHVLTRGLLAFGLLGALVGCPETTRVPTDCAELGQQCRMPAGPLGVCSQTGGTCASPPCLACVSQH